MPVQAITDTLSRIEKNLAVIRSFIRDQEPSECVGHLDWLAADTATLLHDCRVLARENERLRHALDSEEYDVERIVRP